MQCSHILISMEDKQCTRLVIATLGLIKIVELLNILAWSFYSGMTLICLSQLYATIAKFRLTSQISRSLFTIKLDDSILNAKFNAYIFFRFGRMWSSIIIWSKLTKHNFQLSLRDYEKFYLSWRMLQVSKFFRLRFYLSLTKQKFH